MPEIPPTYIIPGMPRLRFPLFFGDYFARRAEEQGNALNYGGVDKCHNCGKHQPITSFEAFAEVDFIVYKKFATDYEEEDDSGKNVGNTFVKTEGRRDFPGTFCRNTIRKEVIIMRMGLNFASHETIMAVNPIPPARFFGNSMIGSRNRQEAGKSAKAARHHHGSDNNLFNIYADVSCGVFTFSHNSDFIAVFAEFKVYKHNDGDNHNNENVEEIFLSETEGSQPASVDWLMTPMTLEPLGTHTMIKKDTSCMAT